ncbi:MAG: tRNA (adenosine(37)-N6)-dimethylallyltransferase MiaA [Actinomycetota bacterium]|nr:MAG: tRNA (adenosine(37)-N6)-dimethylallyltransferase MiaA [Actinomycetota bacterium]
MTPDLGTPDLGTPDSGEPTPRSGAVHPGTPPDRAPTTAGRPTGDAPSVVAIVGPTATGKSDLGIAVAEAVGGEVVNADSMQLYDGMRIGTATVPEQQRRGVPHHLLGVWDIQDPASVVRYRRQARDVIDELLSRGVTPVLVGGSGLYVSAVLDDLEFPGTDPAVRARWESALADRGSVALHAELAAVDPAAAAAILPSNGRRVVRALEVVELHGSFVATLPPSQPVYPSVRLGLELSRPELDARIDARVQRMWAEGLVDEVRRLVERGLRTAPTASRALGYAQVLRLLAGEYDEATAQAETARATRAFARRQQRWFRRDQQVHWLDAAAGDLVDRTVGAVAQRAGTSR